MFVFCKNATTSITALLLKPLLLDINYNSQESTPHPAVSSLPQFETTPIHRVLLIGRLQAVVHSSLSTAFLKAASEIRRRDIARGRSSGSGYNLTTHSCLPQLCRMLKQMKRETTTDCGEEGKRQFPFFLLPSLLCGRKN